MKTQKFSNIESFLSQLDVERNGREDVVMPVRNLGMTDGQLIVDGDSHKLSKMATKQMAWRLGIAPAYWERMVKYRQFDLLDTNVNRWLSLHDADDSYLVSKKEGEVLAFLSPRYKIIDNYETLSNYAEAHKATFGDQSKFRTAGYSADNGQAYIQMVSLEEDRQIAANDPYSTGSVFKFSDVGGGISIAPFLYRQICSNGMMGFGEGKADKIRLNGRAKEDRDYRNDPIYREERPAVIGLTKALGRREIVKPEVQKRIQNLITMKGRKIDDLEATIYALKSQLGLGDDEFTTFAENAIADKIDNYYDLVQAITKQAQDVSVDQQVRLEQVGGWLTDNRGKILDHMIVNIPKVRERLNKMRGEENSNEE